MVLPTNEYPDAFSSVQPTEPTFSHSLEMQAAPAGVPVAVPRIVPVWPGDANARRLGPRLLVGLTVEILVVVSILTVIVSAPVLAEIRHFEPETVLVWVIAGIVLTYAPPAVLVFLFPTSKFAKSLHAVAGTIHAMGTLVLIGGWITLGVVINSYLFVYTFWYPAVLIGYAVLVEFTIYRIMYPTADDFLLPAALLSTPPSEKRLRLLALSAVVSACLGLPGAAVLVLKLFKVDWSLPVYIAFIVCFAVLAAALPVFSLPIMLRPSSSIAHVSFALVAVVHLCFAGISACLLVLPSILLPYMFWVPWVNLTTAVLLGYGIKSVCDYRDFVAAGLGYFVVGAGTPVPAVHYSS